MKQHFVQRWVRPVIIYGLLSAGSLIFAMPLLWMAGTSVKTGREIVESPTSFVPARPIPRIKSPYLETREFSDIPEGRKFLLPAIQQRLKDLGYTCPSDLPPEELLATASAGILQRLDFLVPASEWKLPQGEAEKAVAARVTLKMADEAVSVARKGLCLGALSISSLDVAKQELISSKAVSEGWKIETAGRAGEVRVENLVRDQRPCGLLRYDFGDADTIRLTNTFHTDFNMDRLYRIQLAILPDDSWNILDVYIEKLGVLYKSSFSPSLGGGSGWTTMSWQEKDKDSHVSQIKIWNDLVEEARGGQYVADPQQIKVTLELKRVDSAMAWWKKISRNYEMALRYIPFWRYLATTLFLVLLTLVTTLFSCSLVAYSFARLHWPGRNLCFVLMLATMMIPSQVTMIPQFLIIRELGWYNSLLPLWVPHLFGNAFFIFLMVQFMRGIPKDLEDAAKIDGCGFFRIYWHIMLPLVKPTMVAVGVLTFVSTWNDFMGPLIYINDQQLYPLSFGLYVFTVQSGADVGLNTSMAMAGALLMTLPLIFLFMFAQRYFVQGVAFSGMK